MNLTEISESDAQTTYPLDEILYSGRTGRGVDVTIGRSATYGAMLFMDGELQSAEADERIYHESLVHPALRLAASRKADGLRVLVVGGGEGATVREVLRWGCVAEVDWVDWDEDAVNLCYRHLEWSGDGPWEDSRVRRLWTDIREVLSGADGRCYDCIILDLPDPDHDSGWLYSAEFWELIKSRVMARGVLVTHCGPVRPWGDIGPGWSTVHKAFGNGKIDGFYHSLIPSFQGEWGFWIWTPGDGPTLWREATIELPYGLSVADHEQFAVWALQPAVWKHCIVANIDLLELQSIPRWARLSFS